MPQLPVVKVKQVIKVLKKMGFFKHHQVGSHAQFKHLDGRRTTISIHSGKDVPRKTLKSVIDDLKISTEEFIELLKK